MSNDDLKKSGSLQVDDWIEINYKNVTCKAAIISKSKSLICQSKVVYTLYIVAFSEIVSVSHKELIQEIKNCKSNPLDKKDDSPDKGYTVELNYDDIFLVDAVVLQKKSFDIDLFFPDLDKRLSVSYEKFREMKEEAKSMKQEKTKERKITFRSPKLCIRKEDFKPRNVNYAIKKCIDYLKGLELKENLRFNFNDLKINFCSSSETAVFIECTITSDFVGENREYDYE